MTAESIKRNQIATKKQQLIMAIKSNNPDITQTELAKQANTSQPYVNEVLKKYNIIKKNLDDFKEHKINILHGLQSRLLSSITDRDIQKASMQQKVVSFGVIEDKLAALEGRDTSTMPLIQINIAGNGATAKMSKVEGNQVEPSVLDVKPANE